jgi:hypothetical protein
MLAVVVAIAILGFALDRLLIGLHGRLVYWERLERFYV